MPGLASVLTVAGDYLTQLADHQRDLCPAIQFQLAQDRRYVGFDRAFCYAKFIGNTLVRHTLY